MTRFFAGFATASVLWASAVLVAYLSGVFTPEDAPDFEDDEVASVDPVSDDAGPATKRRRRRRRGGGNGPDEAREGSAPHGNATSGDDLGSMDRTIDGEGTGGEAQLSTGQIDQGFDAAFGRIRRCFVLAAGDEPVTGRITFGLRIAGSGEVTRVNLSGPAAVTTGEAGDCLRTAARGIRFPSFDGPDMVVQYPVTLD